MKIRIKNKIRSLRNIGIIIRIIISYFNSSDIYHRSYIDFLLHHLKWWGDFMNLRYASAFVFGGEWPLEYLDKQYSVDYSYAVPCVKYHDKYIYMPNMSKQKIEDYIRSVDIEQDKRSAHCYFPHGINMKDKVIVDIGGAEGNFAIDYIEDIKELYIFEADKKWIEPLKRTYEKWSDKVTIVNNFVGNGSNGSIRLDDYFSQKKIDIIKIDVEGSEADVIRGGYDTIQTSDDIKLLVCLYHDQNDEKEIMELLHGFRHSYREGYMFYLWEEPIKAPFLRHGVAEFRKLTSTS